MLRVTVEIVPHGDEEKAETLGMMTIANDGTNSFRPQMGNYDVNLVSGRYTNLERRVEDYSRELGFWPLIWKALGECIPMGKLL